MTQNTPNPPEILYHGSPTQETKILLPRECDPNSPPVVCASDIFQYALTHSFRIPRTRCLQMTSSEGDRVVGTAVFAEEDKDYFYSQFEHGPIGSVYIVEGKSFKHFKGKEWRSERPVGVRYKMIVPSLKFLFEQGIQFFCVPDFVHFMKKMNEINTVDGKRNYL